MREIASENVFRTDFEDRIGILSCLDGFMNIALEQTEEHVNGRVTNRYGDAFIRGNNGKTFCTELSFCTN